MHRTTYTALVLNLSVAAHLPAVVGSLAGHLTTGQLAALALELKPLYEEQARERQGTRTDLTSASIEGKVADPIYAAQKAARAVGTSRTAVERFSLAVALTEPTELTEPLRRDA